MSEHDDQPTGSPWSAGNLLSAPAGAVAALAVAFVGLSGQNAIVVGIQSLLGQGFAASSQRGFYVSWGLAVILQVGLVFFLARPAITKESGWATTIARAAFVVSLIAAASGLLIILGGLLMGSDY